MILRAASFLCGSAATWSSRRAAAFGDIECLKRVVHGPPLSPVTVVGVENKNYEDQGQRNAKTLMQILGGDAIQP
ncbi:hypothetical protein OKW37_008169 [Paraburkholderia sp. MM5482-R2]